MAKSKIKTKVRPKRRARGTGSIFWDKRRKCYVARVSAGRKPNGRLRYREVRARTQSEVIARMKAVEPPAPTITLAAWLDRWLPSQHIRLQSRKAYEGCIRLRLKPVLGHIALNKLTPFEIEEAIQIWGRAEDGVGVTTIRLTMQTLSSALQAATRAGIIQSNPARLARKPKPQKFDHQIFTRAELAKIIELAATRPAWRVWGICAAIGCRIGEALAIQPSDYNSATTRLSIARSVTLNGQIGPPKSKHGTRTVTVPSAARPLLEAGLKPMRHSSARYGWQCILQKLSLPYRNPHQLRHSVASITIAAGVPIADVAAFLGDAVATIVNTYTHSTGVDVGSRIGELLNGAEVAQPPKNPHRKPANKAKTRSMS